MKNKYKFIKYVFFVVIAINVIFIWKFDGVIRFANSVCLGIQLYLIANYQGYKAALKDVKKLMKGDDDE